MGRRSSVSKFASDPPRVKSRSSVSKFVSDPPRVKQEAAPSPPSQGELDTLEPQGEPLLQRGNSRLGTWPPQSEDLQEQPLHQRRDSRSISLGNEPQVRRSLVQPKGATRDIYLLRHTYSTARREYDDLNNSKSPERTSSKSRFVNAAIALSKGAGSVLRQRDRLASALLATAKREAERMKFCEYLQKELNSNVEGSGEVLDDAMESQVFRIFAGMHKLQVQNYSHMRHLIQEALDEDDHRSRCLDELEEALCDAGAELELAMKDDPALREKISKEISGGRIRDVHKEIVRTVTSIKEQFSYQRRFDKAAVSGIVAQRRQSQRLDEKQGVSFNVADDQEKVGERIDDSEDEDGPDETEDKEKSEEDNPEGQSTGKAERSFLLDAARGDAGLVRKTRRLNSRVQGAPVHTVLRRDRQSKTLDFGRKKAWRRSGTASGLNLPEMDRLSLALREHTDADDEDDDQDYEGKNESEGFASAFQESGEALPRAAKTELSISDETGRTGYDDGQREVERTERGNAYREGKQHATDQLLVIETGLQESPLPSPTARAEPSARTKARTGARQSTNVPGTPALKQLAALQRRLLKPLRHNWRPPSPWGISGWEWAPAGLKKREDFNIVPAGETSRMASTLPQLSSTASSNAFNFESWRIAKNPTERSLLKVMFPKSRTLAG